MTQREWGNLKEHIQKKLDDSQWKSLNTVVFEQTPSILEFAQFLGMEDVLYEYLDKGKYFDEIGMFNIDPLKRFFNKVIVDIDPNARTAFFVNKNQLNNTISNFIENPTLENMSKLNNSWLLEQIPLDYADKNQNDWIDLFITESPEDNQELFDEFCQKDKNKQIISQLQQQLEDLSKKSKLTYPSWYYKHFFRALLFPESLSHKEILSSMLDIPSSLKSTKFYKLQFCEPRKFIAKNDNTYVFIGEISGKIFISHSKEMSNGETKLQDFVIDENDLIINSSHFDPYHTTNINDKHINYSSDKAPKDTKLSSEELATAIGQPIELLTKYFTQNAEGPHSHIFFPQINAKLSEKLQNNSQLNENSDGILDIIENESIAISVEGLANYTRDIFLATSRDIDPQNTKIYRKMLEIEDFNPTNKDGLISYKAPNKKGEQTDYTIPNSILSNDLGMHYTMFADGTLIYDPIPLLKFLAKTLRRKNNSISRQAYNEIIRVKEFLTEEEEIKNLCYYISEVADNQKSAFGTNAKILQEFNSSVLYIKRNDDKENTDDKDQTISNTPKPLEITFVVALIFKIFNDTVNLLTPVEIQQAMSIIQGTFAPPSQKTEEEEVEETSEHEMD